MQVIQFQSITVFIFGAIISDPDYLMYKAEDSKEFQEYDSFVKDIEVKNLKELQTQLVKSYKGMMKAGAAKTADIMIPKNEKY